MEGSFKLRTIIAQKRSQIAQRKKVGGWWLGGAGKGEGFHEQGGDDAGQVGDGGGATVV
jgi:hypothetical protein